jgi:hypothetical protein
MNGNLVQPTAGETYMWQGLTYRVNRVHKGYVWADIRVLGPRGWSKRQPLPLPAGSTFIGMAGKR